MRLHNVGRLVLCAACCVQCAASCAYAPLRATALSAGRQAQPLPADLAAYYAYPSPPQQVTMEGPVEGARFRQWIVRFPLSAKGFVPTEPTVEFEWYESQQPGRRPAILFNPILGGDYPLERGICRYFAARGFHVALIHRKTLKISPEHAVDRVELLLRQGVVRSRQVVDWLAAQERVDPNRLGGFGISMGGIAAVILAAVEPRLRCHVAALAGGSIPDILMTSKDALLTKPRAQYLARNQMSLGVLEGRFRHVIRTDPIALAPYVDPRRVRLFITLFDRTVGTSNELRLWRVLGRPEATFIPLGHYTALLSLPYLKAASLRFFRKQLAVGRLPD